MIQIGGGNQSFEISISPRQTSTQIVDDPSRMSTQINIDSSIDQVRNQMKNVSKKGVSRQLGVLDERKEEDESEGDGED